MTKPDQPQVQPQIGPDAPPEGEYEHTLDPALDYSQNPAGMQEADAQLQANEAEQQRLQDEAATAVEANNDAAQKALEALRAGDPLQDEPI